MNLELTPEQKRLQKNARDYMQREIIPIADEYDLKYKPFPKELAKEFLKKLAPLGYLGCYVPKEDGGWGLDYITSALLIEELSRAYASLALLVMIDQGSGAWCLSRHGTKEQKKAYLAPMLSGELVSCFCSTEPNVGSNASSIETTATLKGNHYIINGAKTWITAGPIADIANVVASVDRSKGIKGISRFLVDRSESPFASREIPKLGLRSCPMGEVTFDNCRIPRENLQGEEGKGYQMTLEDFLFFRPGTGVMAVGIAQASLDASTKYALERKQFGKPIGSFQLIQEMIADMAIETQAARWLVFQAYSLMDHGVKCFKESSMAKAYATEVATRVTSKGIEIHGAYGISQAYPLQRYLRDAHTLMPPDATTQIQKLIVGREILGVSAFV